MDIHLGTIKFVTLHSFYVHSFISLTIVSEDFQRDIIVFLLLLYRFLVSGFCRSKWHNMASMCIALILRR